MDVCLNDSSCTLNASDGFYLWTIVKETVKFKIEYRERENTKGPVVLKILNGPWR